MASVTALSRSEIVGTFPLFRHVPLSSMPSLYVRVLSAYLLITQKVRSLRHLCSGFMLNSFEINFGNNEADIFSTDPF